MSVMQSSTNQYVIDVPRREIYHRIPAHRLLLLLLIDDGREMIPAGDLLSITAGVTIKCLFHEKSARGKIITYYY